MKINTYDYKNLTMNDINNIHNRLKKNLSLTITECFTRLDRAVNIMKGLDDSKGVKENTGTPCSDCGSIEFLRTGTCSVCCLCGTSQGCS